MARCNFCRRNFRSAQAVRAHLRWCDAYTGREPEEESLIGEDAYKEGEPKAQSRGFDPVHHVRQQVQTEEQRLRLRQIQSAHHELDEKERRKAEHPQREERR